MKKHNKWLLRTLPPVAPEGRDVRGDLIEWRLAWTLALQKSAQIGVIRLRQGYGGTSLWTNKSGSGGLYGNAERTGQDEQDQPDDVRIPAMLSST